MVTVGLTGGIGTGKSLVSGYFRELGAYIVDYDVISRKVVEPGLPAWRDIVKHFGQEVLREDRGLDRAKLGRIVFGDEKKRKILESIVHPRLTAEIEGQQKAAFESDPDALVIHDVPLLFETGVDKVIKINILVLAREDVQVKRVMQRDGLSEEDVKSRIRAQMPLSEKAARADYIIENNGSMEETKKRVETLFRKLCDLEKTGK